MNTAYPSGYNENGLSTATNYAMKAVSEQTLVFSRDRDDLPNGDYGREVIQQIMKKLTNLNRVLKYQNFIEDISKDFKTNISINIENLTSLLAYKGCLDKVIFVQY